MNSWIVGQDWERSEYTHSFDFKALHLISWLGGVTEEEKAMEKEMQTDPWKGEYKTDNSREGEQRSGLGKYTATKEPLTLSKDLLTKIWEMETWLK